MINKKELVDAVAEKLNFSKKDTNLVITTTLDTIIEKMIAGEEVNIKGFGKFVTKDVAEKPCVNPQTGEKMVCPAHKRPSFSYSSVVKASVK